MDNLKTSFGKLKVTKKQKTSMVQDVFDNVSVKYDLMNDLMSFGAHRIWKKNLIDLINLQENDKIIDVGSGTGDLFNIINKNYSNIVVYSLDLNFKMLNNNNNSESKNNNQNYLINCNAEKLPFKENTFDKYLISFCLRNITMINKALSEAYRVLKPGGSFYCLEFSSPNSAFVNKIYKYYKKYIIPKIGEKVAQNKKAYQYLEQSISEFPNQKIFLDKINEIGFLNSSYVDLFDGIVSIHKGYKV